MTAPKSLADKLALAVKTLDEVAWWHTDWSHAPSGAMAAREALKLIRGGDGRPPAKEEEPKPVEELRGIVQGLNAHGCTVLNNTDGDLIVILPDHLSQAVRDRVRP